MAAALAMGMAVAIAAAAPDSCAAQSATASLCDVSFPLGANVSVRANTFTTDGQLNPEQAATTPGTTQTSGT